MLLPYPLVGVQQVYRYNINRSSIFENKHATLQNIDVTMQSINLP